MTSRRGNLYVFEGADGVGKSELSRRFFEHLTTSGVDCEYLAFPGKDAGTLGKLIYDIHHESERFGIHEIGATSLQILHIAAHVDAIENRIIPALKAGRSVVLDRFWWSTKVYGIVAGAGQEILDAMVRVELLAWGNIRPTMAFLIRRDKPLRQEPLDTWKKWRTVYDSLAAEQAKHHDVHLINNNSSIDDSMHAILQATNYRVTRNWSFSQPDKNQLSFEITDNEPKTSSPYVFSSIVPAKPTVVFDTYWRFAAERQSIFFKRLAERPPPWTNDPILMQHKFTNAYRASDRVSQYLIRNVIYKGDRSPDEIFFRIILFKLFNKIETWELLTKTLGDIRYADYSYERYDRILTNAMNSDERIYSAAYIMPSGSRSFGTTRKHRAHLKLLERMMEDELPYRIADSRNMHEAFSLFRSYPMIGDFLAYQYVTDINYSTLTNFSEMDFVMPGPGALNGIRKCFDSLGGLNEIDIIKVVADRQHEEFERLGLKFQTLWGRPLQLIDCQNLFCEVDKYARVKHPEITGITSRTRIKQIFRPTSSLISFWYPPKWGLNERIANQGGAVVHE
ncbi:MAG: nucleotide kinase domain-containing protein [Acidiferrobacterales bacterium]